MTKLRRHHTRSGRGGGVFTVRLIMVFILIGAMIAAVVYLSKTDFFSSGNLDTTLSPNYDLPEDRFFIPTTRNGEIVHHKFYSLSYDEDAEQAEWVAYYLSKASLQKENVPRAKRFNEDPKVPTGSAAHSDYIRSGYDRGHLVPAADMAFSKTAMQETFFMSNISPQKRNFNGAVWRELEESVRDWAYKFKGLYIISGPIFGNNKERIGKSKVLVPEFYFKVLLDLDSNNKKAIAFKLPNKVSYEPLAEYAITIDELERETGFDFFAELLDDPVEEKMESTIDIDDWPFSEKRFDLRNTKWNRVQ